MKTARLATGLLAGTLVLAGCAGTSTDGDGGGDTGSSGELSAVPGFDPQDGKIRIGIIDPFSGPLATAGEGLLLGTEIYVDRINADGGIAGKYPIELVTGDSKYDPQTAVSVYNDMADDVVMLGQVLGAGVIGALLPQAATDDMLIIPGTDSNWLREPNVLPVRPSYEANIVNGLAYLTDEGAEDKLVCSLIQDDPTGESAKVGADFAVEELGLDFGEEVRFPIGNSNFTPQISRLDSAGCEVVVYGSTIASAIPAVSTAVQLGFDAQWLGYGPSYGEPLLGSPVIDYISKNWTISTSGAQWGDESVPGMAQLIEDFEKYAPEGAKPQPPQNIAGYTYGIAMVEMLERAVDRGDLSHASLLEISHSDDLALDFQGLTPEFQYGPVDERQGPTASTIFAVDPAVTGGLRKLEQEYDSEAAQAFEYE